MPIPDAPRTVYQKNPLIEVICQLKFSPILKVDSEIPANFQEIIRGEYPIFEEKSELDPEKHLPPEVSRLLERDFPIKFKDSKKSYDFISEDKNWTIGLQNHFLSLTTKVYERWEDFKKHLETPLEALIEVYKPNSFSRIGLRYRNLIKRSELDLKDSEWTDLLKSQFLGPPAWTDFKNEVRGSTTEFLLDLDDDKTQIKGKYGLVNVKGTEEICYLIDNDFFTLEKTEIGDAFGKLQSFSRRAGKFFRWCIEDQLHKAMEPKSS